MCAYFKQLLYENGFLSANFDLTSVHVCLSIWNEIYLIFV
jgi:hypothetical protein